MKRTGLAAALCCGCAAACATPAFAHAICGSRVFPVTLTMDDPGVADEASLPTVSELASTAAPGAPSVRTEGVNFEYDKRITENLGVAFNYGVNFLQGQGLARNSGFQNLVFTTKYQACLSPSHEFMVSFGVQREFGWTGTTQAGADAYGSTAPTVYFGKGFGDLPVPLLRPFAITGEFADAIADRELKIAPQTGFTNNGAANQWYGAMSLQYSLPYLASQVHDFGLPEVVNRLVPLVEVTWTSPASAPSTLGTTWTFAPGAVYEARWYQLGLEALIPADRAAGHGVGVIAQFHVFLDDLFPDSIGRPIF
jgi:hypothetical protein